MDVYDGICLEDFTVKGQEGTSMELKRGKSYTISKEKEGKVVVFSRYWASVPAHIFGGIQRIGDD